MRSVSLPWKHRQRDLCLPLSDGIIHEDCSLNRKLSSFSKNGEMSYTVLELNIYITNLHSSYLFQVSSISSEDRTFQFTLDEEALTQCLYMNEPLFTRLGKEFCLLYDVALNKGGTEAIVESLYSVMKTQAQSGRQSNKTLVTRTKVDWHYPKTSINIPSVINEATKILNKVKKNPFTKTTVTGMSKVLERVSSDVGRIPL